MANKKNADIAEKVYWRDNKHFADLFNTVFFDGRQVIREEELTEADSEVSNYVFSKEDVSAISKTRDMIKKASANADFVLNRLLFQMIKDVNRLSKKELLEKYKSENISKSVVITVGKVTGTKALVDWALQREGDEIMCTNMDRIFAEERAEGRQEGRKAGLEEARREIIQRMLSKGMDKELIADILDISIDEIKTVCTVV